MAKRNKVCRFYLEGRCKFGKRCHNIHPQQEYQRTESIQQREEEDEGSDSSQDSSHQESDSSLEKTDSLCVNCILRETRSKLQTANTRLQEHKHKVEELIEEKEKLEGRIQMREDVIQREKEKNQRLSEENEKLQERIQRREDVIQRQEEENQRLLSQLKNPHWLVQSDEVQMTHKILGTGGWGEVKVGVFRGTKVAVKCLHQMILSEYNLDLFSREMDIASRVRHPNLLRFIGATRVGNPMVLTELMPSSLRKKLEETNLTHPQILTISGGVAAALNYLHLWKPHAILHRDVSSANVLLEPSGNGQWKGKLSDYGSANLLDKISTVGPGNPAYAAPEAQSPNLHSPAMDVFSFGILLVEMVTCRLPSGSVLEREEQIRKIRWSSIKLLAERCTENKSHLRPTIKHVLQEINQL